MSFLGKLFGGGPTIAPTPVTSRDEFDDAVLESEIPVIVNVFGPACGPCRRMAPVLVRVATKYAGRVRVVDISTESDPHLLAALEVRATPTLIMYDRGEELGRMTGFRPEGWFDDMIATEFPDA